MSFFSSPLISLTEKGLYCEAGGFYIDPHCAVDLAVVTHAHSDHARRGSARYLTADCGIGVLKERVGKKIDAQGIPYGQTFHLGRVQVSFHSAGHILGSAQVRIEYDGEVWVASGDYKRDRDPSCHPFEIVKCDTFITEATFGTPKFVWPKDCDHGLGISTWWDEMIAEKKNAVLFGYSLGKAQRILAELYPYAKKPVLIHSSIAGITERYREEGRELAPTENLLDRLASHEDRLVGELILAPPSIFEEKFAHRFGEYETAFASGWMQNHSPYSQNRYDRGFVMSDHADWNDLNQTIRDTGAKRVFVQHRNGTLIRHLRKNGIHAFSDEALKLENYRREFGGETLPLWPEDLR